MKIDKTLVAISIHAAREGGDRITPARIFLAQISIHAAREGGDQGYAAEICHGWISIHAAREGGDVHVSAADAGREHFNPRRP